LPHFALAALRGCDEQEVEDSENEQDGEELQVR
jgi:hypothetical protein